jgi:alkyl hydroperoxide reductase subunit AhpC
MGRTAQLAQEFARRDTKPLGLSTDSVAQPLKWIADVNETQHTTVDFPIVADADLVVARLYDMIHAAQSNTEAVRSVLILDPSTKIRLMMTYPMNVGRNFEEILRVIDALQLADSRQVATPADWESGKLVIIPLSISDENANDKFPKGWQAPRPYLRFTDVN